MPHNAPPVGDYAQRLASSGLVSEDVLHVCIPLTPSGNEILNWSYNTKTQWELRKHKADMLVSVRAIVYRILGSRNTPWASMASLCAARCGNRWVDVDNMVSGMKYAIDALVRCNVLPDDNPSRLGLGLIQSRSKSEWGRLYGPATHIFVCKIGGSKYEDYERVLKRVFYYFELQEDANVG